MTLETWSLNMHRVVFIGSNPSIKSAKLTPFWRDTNSSKVLKSWLEHLQDEEDVSFYNVSDTPTENNRPLKVSEIKANLQLLKYKLDTYSLYKVPIKVVALGKTAEKALTLLHIPHFAMPHPSGLNRKLNDKAYVGEKLKALIEFIQK